MPTERYFLQSRCPSGRLSERAADRESFVVAPLPRPEALRRRPTSGPDWRRPAKPPSGAACSKRSTRLPNRSAQSQFLREPDALKLAGRALGNLIQEDDLRGTLKRKASARNAPSSLLGRR